jgi:hypothetical protein
MGARSEEVKRGAVVPGRLRRSASSQSILLEEFVEAGRCDRGSAERWRAVRCSAANCYTRGVQYASRRGKPQLSGAEALLD